MKYPLERGVQNTVIGSGMSQEINREPAQYPYSRRLGRAKISNSQSLVMTNRITTNFQS